MAHVVMFLQNIFLYVSGIGMTYVVTPSITYLLKIRGGP